jgi:hypothetical protein
MRHLLLTPAPLPPPPLHRRGALLVNCRGKFMFLSELDAMMEREQFVPGGLKAWQETVDRSLHTTYLK